MEDLTITRPDDWHLHLRDGEHMRAVLADSARRFARAIVMPNLRPPITTTQSALAYRQRIVDALPEGSGFRPLMTLYLTDNTSPQEIEAKSGFLTLFNPSDAEWATDAEIGRSVWANYTLLPA